MLLTELEYTIPFHDVDPMNIVWHGHYVRYFELVRCKLLEKLDYTYRQMFESGYAWPVVDMRIKYIKPIKYEQHIILEAELEEYEYRLKISYRILDAATREKLTSGFTIQVAVNSETGEMCFQSPDILLDKLRRHAAI